MPPTPSRFVPWQLWQPARPVFAEYAWKPALVLSIHEAAWPLTTAVPERCWPMPWHAVQSARVAVALTAGWVAGSRDVAWHAVYARGAAGATQDATLELE